MADVPSREALEAIHLERRELDDWDRTERERLLRDHYSSYVARQADLAGVDDVHLAALVALAEEDGAGGERLSEALQKA